ncbi:MAG: nucleotidyl transferase AbiEii/AbiGii toxin family protein [Candidatus Helarchaeota archaeon]
MIPSREIRERAREHGVPETTVERDYTQNWLLKYLSQINMVLKGGTGIRKVYIGNYRFSDDLDFTLVAEMKKEALKTRIANAVRDAKEESGIDFGDKIVFNENPNGYEVIVYFRILKGAGSPLRIKLDITRPEKEKMLLPIQKKNIIHPYSDRCAANISVYSLEEIVAEKIRALFERTRPRDIYDIWALSDKIDKKQMLSILMEKFKFKNVTFDISSINRRIDDFGHAWESSLSHQMRDLPEFNEVFSKVIKLVDSYASH